MVIASPLSTLRGRRVWLTGARGFVGARLAELVAEAGADVHAFPGDVRERDAVLSDARAFAPDLMLHLAAPVNVARDPALVGPMHDVIVVGARHVRRAAVDAGARLVQVGTCEEYGTIPAPFAESDTPSAPVSPYAAAKLAATREALQEADRCDVVVARPFLTYGPGQRPRQLVPALIDAALAGRPFPMTEGLQTREVNYVDDVVLGLLRAALTPEARGRVVNIGGGEELRVVDLARRIVRLAGADEGLLQIGALPTRSGEVPRFCSDPTLCRTLLGHAPSVSLDEGLSLTLAHRRAEIRS
jgi:nucleoside-diphosphate-sugar epimerase